MNTISCVNYSMVEPLNPHHLDPSDPHNLQETDEPVLERIAIATEGGDCDECVRKLRDPLMKIKGVRDVRVDTNRERVVITFDARKTHAPDLQDAILRSGYKPGAYADNL
jgi:copper chaperone CopZ